MRCILIALVIGIASAAGPAAEQGAGEGSGKGVRTWTSTRGQKLDAAFVKMQSGCVYLRTAEGRDVQITLMELVSEDRELARKLGAPQRPKPVERSYAGKYAGTYRSEGWNGTLECVLAEAGKGELSAAWAAIHSDKKTYNYSGSLKLNADGKYEGVFDVRKPKEFRVTGSFDGSKFAGVIAMADGSGKEKTTGELSMTRKSGE